MNIDFEQTLKDVAIWQEKKDELFSKEFQQSLEDYVYRCSGLETISQKSNADFLFKRFNTEFEIYPTFQLLEDETKAEKQRFNNTTFAVYSFNENDVVKTPIRIDISNKINKIPEHLQEVTKDGKKPVSRIDIEFYEKTSLLEDSKNEELKDFIQEYLVNGNWSKDDLKELGNLMALEDLEKIHTEFLVFEDDSIVPIYIGIGNNQPYNISEKSAVYGKNRFYRYDLVKIDGKAYQQTSKVTPGKRIDFSDQDLIAPEATCNGALFALHFKDGITILDRNVWKKATLNQPIEELNLHNEIANSKGVDFLKERLLNVFPDFDSYSQVFYDPLERTNSYTHSKTIIYLKQKGLLGQGWQAKINVASGLYLNGHDPVLRIKPSLMLMYHMIETDKFRELIINTSKHIDTAPFDNG
ncbi:hypothetical protein [Cyanobium sp. L1E-Cus]|uniref:hypothetical protein n=1 Tax=Cyanobium sp. L1E-Cus TaxID=2823714 RepID=UPI0020CB8530|nr:hypothetical protein [Cyanobium sp. L1E-Cus]MCP9821297.1 hypothetical protein [Cyanobium sp. L1E-Cus]